jgi:hypothetical protein
MVGRDRLDGETRAEIGRALLVGDGFVPDVHAPVVRRDVEHARLLRIGHRHPVLAAKEARRGEHDLALSEPSGAPGRPSAVKLGRPVLGLMPSAQVVCMTNFDALMNLPVKRSST